MLELAGRTFDMAGPLKRNLLVRTDASPLRNRKINTFKVKVVAWIWQRVQCRACGTFKNCFSGPMRTNLLAMLDGVGVGKALGLASTASLWAKDAGRDNFQFYTPN